MSRLIVKNLPKSVTEDKLRELFSEKGVVTDVQLKYTKDGKFRHFGFVGFKAQEAAQNAVDYFNNTCIKAARISVELCAGLGDPKKPKAWSKYAPESTAFKQVHGELTKVDEIEKEEKGGKKKKKVKEKKKQKNSQVLEVLEKHKNDPLFAEFMEAHAKGSKTMWSNDAVAVEDKKAKAPEDEDEDEVYKKEEGADLDHESSHSAESDESSDEQEVENKVAVKKEISDLEYIKMKTVKEDEISSELPDQSIIEEEKPKSKKGVKQPKPHIDYFTVKLRGLSAKAKKKDVKQFFHPLKPKSIRVPRKIKGIAYVGFKTEKEMKQALTKHKSFLAGKRILVVKYFGEGEMNPSNGSNEQTGNRWKDQEENLKNEETIAESGRLFIRNLSYTVVEEDIENLFKEYGPLAEVNMPVDRLTRKPKGFATVTFVMPEHAVRAHSELDGTVFHGRMLHLLAGKAKKSLEELMEMENLTFQQKKVLQQKVEAKSSHNWNALFLGQNAIADIIADTYNTTKEKVLDPRGSESIAVRLALGETQIITQTREFLVKNGVSLDAFNQAPKQRSKTVILAKNLPAKTTANEMHQLFMKHGEIGRIVLPPSGVSAIIEFLEPSEARSAFTKLAYTKFKHLPLYLEWAPLDAFTSEFSKEMKQTHQTKEDEAVDSKDGNTPTPTTDGTANEESDEEDEEEPEPDTTLFIKNLSFKCNEDSVKEHFKKCGPIHNVTVARKKDPKNPGELLSMGYGFIQFKRKASLEKALKTLQQSVLEGHSVELKRSNRTVQTEVATARKKTKIGKQTGSKILVRNIPFQAHKKEIEDLFKAFGELKAIRLPKKMAGTGPHRGFAFIEYYTKHDAKRAFEALCQSTHLYGRRLALEWATAVDNIDDLRKRTADHFLNSSTHHTSKKSTTELNLDNEK